MKFSNNLPTSRSEWVHYVKQFGDVSIVTGVLQLLLPRWINKLFKINFFKVEPINRLGLMFSKILKERSGTGVRYQDLSETLQKAINDGLDMDDQSMVGNSLLAIFAGVDTTSSALCKMVEYLVEYPEVQSRLYTEVKRDFSAGIHYENLTQHAYLDAFCSESLRLGPPVHFIARHAVKVSILFN